MDSQSLAAAQAALKYTFKDPALLELALRHASVAPSRLSSNERLEFLGDSVLGLITCHAIYAKHPTLLEGEMTKIKSLAVSRQVCNDIARAMGLHTFLDLGKGMSGSEELPVSLAAAALEAVTGAIYLDGGFAAAEAFVRPLVEPHIDSAFRSGHQQNFKSVLQQHAQQLPAMNGGIPVYRILDEKGPDHAKCFKIAVEIGGRRFTASWAQSKKRAEQLAALNALRDLNIVAVDDATGEVTFTAGHGGVPAGTVNADATCADDQAK